jgi:Fe-S cluster assembly protein SufD
MVRWVRLFESSGFTTTHTQVHCHGQLHHTLFLGGSGLNRHMTDITLATENAYASLHGLSIPTPCSPTTNNQQPTTSGAHTDFTTRITLAHPHTTSRVQHRQVVGENAHAVFQGQFIIPAHARKTEGHMLVQSLLTAPTARATAKPELAIEADDVQCTHGATTGTLDENQLFYLQARGLSSTAARRMLMEAFIADILADTLPADLTPHVQSKVEQWLNK